MSIEIGTASGYMDFLRKFRAFTLAPEPGGAGWLPIAGGADSGDSEGCLEIGVARSNYHDLLDGGTEDYAAMYDGEHITIKCVNEIEIKSIKITMPSLTGGGLVNSSPDAITLIHSTDGVSWATAGTWSGLSVWSDHESRTFDLPAPITAQHWGFRVDSSNDGGYAYVGELQLFDSAGVRNYINFQYSDTRGTAKRWGIKSPFSASGVSAHLWFNAFTDARVSNFTLAISGYSDMYEFTEEGSDMPRIAGRDGSSATYCYLRDSEMDYWFYGDTRQIYAFVRVGSTIQQFGGGYFLPYATPAQYPLPMFVGAANSNSWTNYENDTDYGIRGFTNPGNGAMYVFRPENYWEEVQNYDMHNNAERLNPSEHCLWPGNLEFYNELRNAPGANDNDGNYILYPAVIKRSGNSVYGELKNIYLIPSLNLSSGDTITISGDTYRVFQNQWRTSRQDFCAVKEE